MEQGNTNQKTNYKPAQTKPKTDNRPDFDLVAFDEGISTKVGVCWTNEGTGKKATVELDREKIAGKGKMKVWMIAKREKEKEKSSVSSKQ